jgi:hypothetical protein
MYLETFFATDTVLTARHAAHGGDGRARFDATDKLSRKQTVSGGAA